MTTRRERSCINWKSREVLHSKQIIIEERMQHLEVNDAMYYMRWGSMRAWELSKSRRGSKSTAFKRMAIMPFIVTTTIQTATRAKSRRRAIPSCRSIALLALRHFCVSTIQRAEEWHLNHKELNMYASWIQESAGGIAYVATSLVRQTRTQESCL